MSLNELEMQVQQLPKPELAKFSERFDVFREANALTADAQGDIAAVQREEVLRRKFEDPGQPRPCQRMGRRIFRSVAPTAG